MRNCMIVIWWSRMETQDFREQELKYYKKMPLFWFAFIFIVKYSMYIEKFMKLTFVM